ncbi:MAG: leucine-rich repeat domain-containing protein [Thermoguttaceae bacterium]|nr:leucine-rich repeat domain-containing protein [Thermoguttaceae bacterium]
MNITLSNIPWSVERLEIPEYVTHVGWYACNGRPHLREVIFPKGLIVIEHEAFQSCEALRSVALPEGLRQIGRFAFRYCSNLEKIYIPRSVTQIGYEVFVLCPKLTIYTSAGSYATEYAKEFKIPVEIVQHDQD